jgi:serine/threonine protein kinase
MPALEIDQRFERYRIIQWLSSGVSGESYEAQDTLLDRKVTLKLIHPSATLPDAARRQFFREMQGISILNHPYLAQVLDYGEFDGKLYVARRFVSNGSLLSHNGRLWFNAPLDVFDAVHYGVQLAQALQFIHNRGHVHGAITLSNILISHNPVSENTQANSPFLLTDAGLTHFVRSSSKKNSAPLPITAAPEQLYKRTIPASDQFSLAALLYLWLTGHPPFIGSPEEIEQLKLTETITPLSSFKSNISIAQDGIILRALSVSPEDRYPSVQAFADALLLTLSPKTSLTFAPASTHHSISNEHVIVEQTPQLPARHAYEENPRIESEAEILRPVVDDLAITAHLIIFSPYADEPYIVELQSDEITIGRAGSSDILLDRDDLTSRHHALLKRENNRFLIFDRRSANGIQINGLPIQSDQGYPLIDGDHITIGNYELTFRTLVRTVIDQDYRSFASSL